MTDLTERKLKACQVKPIDDVPYSEELQALKEKNERQKELIKTLGSDIDYLDTKKMVLIVEVNNLKSLLKECKELIKRSNGCFTSNGFETAQEALAKIKEIK